MFQLNYGRWTLALILFPVLYFYLVVQPEREAIQFAEEQAKLERLAKIETISSIYLEALTIPESDLEIPAYLASLKNAISLTDESYDLYLNDEVKTQLRELGYDGRISSVLDASLLALKSNRDMTDKVLEAGLREQIISFLTNRLEQAEKRFAAFKPTLTELAKYEEHFRGFDQNKLRNTAGFTLEEWRLELRSIIRNQKAVLNMPNANSGGFAGPTWLFLRSFYSTDTTDEYRWLTDAGLDNGGRFARLFEESTKYFEKLDPLVAVLDKIDSEIQTRAYARQRELARQQAEQVRRKKEEELREKAERDDAFKEAGQNVGKALRNAGDAIDETTKPIQDFGKGVWTELTK